MAGLGETVVLIGTSTGGTLAMWAATREEAQDRLGAVVMLSPNYQPATVRRGSCCYPGERSSLGS